MDLVVVGAGLYGLTTAYRAAQDGLKVLILEKRDTLGGNAYSYVDEKTGIEIHKYGSHLFHTSNQRVWEFANLFTQFSNYQHRVFTLHKQQIFALPINLHTINQYFGTHLSPTEAKKFLNDKIANDLITEVENAESKAISLIGQELYSAFYKNYTKKQWQTDPNKIPSEIISRLPVRYNYNSRYFNDKWEGLPLQGYFRWFENLVNHKNIEVRLGHDFLDLNNAISKKYLVGQLPIIYTGPIDKYFEYCFGLLSWRTLHFETIHMNLSDFQGTSVMNYADLDVEFTRIHEFKHLHPERTEIFNSGETVVAREYSKIAGHADEPYYPVNSEADRLKLSSYKQLASTEPMVFFGGRLGSYKYFDMHMAIGAALTFWDKMTANRMQLLKNLKN